VKLLTGENYATEGTLSNTSTKSLHTLKTHVHPITTVRKNSANARQLFTKHYIQYTVPPIWVFISTMPGCAATTSPMNDGVAPKLMLLHLAKHILRTSGATTASSFPSLPRRAGPAQELRQAPFTESRTGIEFSCRIMPTPARFAISFNVVAAPPRVGLAGNG